MYGSKYVWMIMQGLSNSWHENANDIECNSTQLLTASGGYFRTTRSNLRNDTVPTIFNKVTRLSYVGPWSYLSKNWPKRILPVLNEIHFIIYKIHLVFTRLEVNYGTRSRLQRNETTRLYPPMTQGSFTLVLRLRSTLPSPSPRRFMWRKNRALWISTLTNTKVTKQHSWLVNSCWAPLLKVLRYAAFWLANWLFNNGSWYSR